MSLLLTLPGPLRFPFVRFGIGIFYVLLYMLLKVAFDGAGWLVAIGNVVQLLYLFLIIVQVRTGRAKGEQNNENIASACPACPSLACTLLSPCSCLAACLACSPGFLPPLWPCS